MKNIPNLHAIDYNQRPSPNCSQLSNTYFNRIDNERAIDVNINEFLSDMKVLECDISPLTFDYGPFSHSIRQFITSVHFADDEFQTELDDSIIHNDSMRISCTYAVTPYILDQLTAIGFSTGSQLLKIENNSRAFDSNSVSGILGSVVELIIAFAYFNLIRKCDDATFTNSMYKLPNLQLFVPQYYLQYFHSINVGTESSRIITHSEFFTANTDVIIKSNFILDLNEDDLNMSSIPHYIASWCSRCKHMDYDHTKDVVRNIMAGTYQYKLDDYEYNDYLSVVYALVDDMTINVDYSGLVSDDYKEVYNSLISLSSLQERWYKYNGIGTYKSESVYELMKFSYHSATIHPIAFGIYDHHTQMAIVPRFMKPDAAEMNFSLMFNISINLSGCSPLGIKFIQWRYLSVQMSYETKIINMHEFKLLMMGIVHGNDLRMVWNSNINNDELDLSYSNTANNKMDSAIVLADIENKPERI